MSSADDALLFLDLDKRGEDAGPLFDEPRRRLQADPRLRAGWSQFQALRALAWECAPEPGDKLLRQALLQSRRERVKTQLAKAAGDEALAREILLGNVKVKQGLPAWMWMLLLGAGLLLGVIAYKRGLFNIGPPMPATQPLPASVIKGPDDPLPLEFGTQIPPQEAALSAPVALSGAAGAEDVHHEDAASRRARLLMRQHLYNAEARAQAAEDDAPAALPTPAPRLARSRARSAPGVPPPPRPTTAATAVPLQVELLPEAGARPGTPPAMGALASALTAAPTALPTVVPTSVPTVVPTPVPTVVPTRVPSPAPTPVPTPVPTPRSSLAPTPVLKAGTVATASLTLSTADLAAGGTVQVTLALPQRKDLDLRVFDMRGKPVRVLAAGAYGPGTARFEFITKDDAGQALPAGTYYLRAMTDWFSRVEPIQIH